MVRRRVRGAPVVVALLLVLVAAVGCASAPAPAAPPPPPLRILLVNDDGWNAPGIVALRDGLRKAGHRVVEIAPVADRSSSGTATTTAGELLVRHPTRDPDLYTVSGTAADAVLVGVRAVMGDEWPDLVISGINPQPSIGVSALQSGTVGAALTAAGSDFPSLAVSTDVADPARARPTDFTRPVDFTVRLVAMLVQRKPDGARLVPQRTVLNVNYPRGPERPEGVVAAPSSNQPSTLISYRYGRSPDRYIPVPSQAPATGEESDARALARGQVTLTDLSADPDRSAPPPRTAAELAPLLQP